MIKLVRGADARSTEVFNFLVVVRSGRTWQPDVQMVEPLWYRFTLEVAVGGVEIDAVMKTMPYLWTFRGHN